MAQIMYANLNKLIKKKRLSTGCGCSPRVIEGYFTVTRPWFDFLGYEDSLFPKCELFLFSLVLHELTTTIKILTFFNCTCHMLLLLL
jgi:hypothetical protein